MPKGPVRRYFPGGNTSKGFYSFYEYITPPDANKIFIIKGGPGVGKSTFMRAIAEELNSRGFEVEYFHCSSDNNSLDGIRFPAIDVAFIDGTAPHIVDPRNPGAVDEIIHLGDYWDEGGMRAGRESILSLNAEVGRLFRRAYGYLAAARIFLDEYKSPYTQPGVLDLAGLNAETLNLIGDIFGTRSRTGAKPRQRHLFATAITPDGPRSHLDTVVGEAAHRYVITGDPGTGKSTMVGRVAEAAALRGYDAEVFHCALDPSHIDHVVIPDLGTAVINGGTPHGFTARLNDTVIDTGRYVNRRDLSRFSGEMKEAMRRHRDAFDSAVAFLERAKKAHDEMETYYVPNMRFDQITRRRDATLERVLQLAAERTSTPIA